MSFTRILLALLLIAGSFIGFLAFYGSLSPGGPRRGPVEVAPLVREVIRDGGVVNEFDLQEVTVRLPPGIKPKSVTAGGFWLFLDWPGLVEATENGATAGERANWRVAHQVRVFVMVKPVAGQAASPDTGAGQRGDADSLIARRLSWGTILGPELNAGSGLLEYRRPEDRDMGFLYVSPDESFVDGLGYRPYVTCSPRATGESSRRCTSFGNIREGVFYRYAFTDLLLPAWPQLGQAVYDLLAESMTPQ